MTHCSVILRLVIAIALIALTANAAVSEPIPPSSGPQPEKRQTLTNAGTIPQRYIIQLADPPVALYRGGIKTLAPTNPRANQQAKLDMRHKNVAAYRQHLVSQHRGLRTAMQRVIRRPVQFRHEYFAAFNGLALELTSKEAAAVAKLPGVVRVKPEKSRRLHTDAGPEWIGAPAVWDGGAATAIKGEGIVVGVIDTGIVPENPSFADVADDGFDHTNPKGRFFGVCDPSRPDYDVDFPCNDKLIGAYDFTYLAPQPGNPETARDVGGHGSHTASTAAGNVVYNATIESPTITIAQEISGVAPRASIISYRACYPDDVGECPLSALLAAIDQAVMDGVDVINYSIGGPIASPWEDADALAFLGAREAGIFVAASAGNDGPDPESLKSPGAAPWLMTVGASTHHRAFLNRLEQLTKFEGPPLPNISGRSITAGYGPAAIVYAGNYVNPNDPNGDPAQCLRPYPAGTFDGEIVVCDRGAIARVEKCDHVKAGGAGGFVLANDAANAKSLNADAHSLPAVHITYEDGVTLKNWLAGGTGHRAAIAGTAVVFDDNYADIMAAFSSRGVNSGLPSVIKPDVTAPGVDIFAAVGIDNEIAWGSRGGTSMSSPHAAGAAALLRALYPSWSPAQIQSALMMTAATGLIKEDHTNPANAFDMGSGRIDVAKSARAGFVLDESHANFLAADPNQGGDPSGLNLASLAADQAFGDYSWRRVLKSTLNTAISWNVSVINPPGVLLMVDPVFFTLPPGGSQTVNITAGLANADFDQWLMGQVIFSTSSSLTEDAHFPVAVKRMRSNLPTEVFIEDADPAGAKILKNLRTIEISDLTVSVCGLVAAEVFQEILYQDPTPADPWDAWANEAPENGNFRVERHVDSGTKRLVAEITETTAPNIDMRIFYWDGESWQYPCTQTNSTALEYCNIDNPEPATYHILIQNKEAGDPQGNFADTVMLAVAAVPAIEDGNMTVDTADGSSSIPGGQPFDLVINWNLGNPSPYWYGAFALGSNPSNPDNLGWTDVSLKRRPCAGNFNGDSVQDGSDLAIFVQQFGGTDCAGGMYCDGDFDRDRDVDGSNLARFSADTGRTDCPH